MDGCVGSTAVLMNPLAKSSAVQSSLSLPVITHVTVLGSSFLALYFLWVFSFPLPSFVTALQPSLTPWIFWYHHSDVDVIFFPFKKSVILNFLN